jgi:hypothetical protein
MGTNPFSLLAWWAASEVASRSASAVTTRVLHQKSLAMLHDMVRVIGYEVASLYGGDVRHRDANWIYGVELTELVSRFPLSRDSLSSALQEVGSIQLLNEYDRIFLYRCLAAHRSAQPQRYAATLSLTSVQRQAVATRLEKFYAAYIHGKTPQNVSRWRGEAEERLGIKLQLDAHEPAGTHQERIEDAINSLASFLVSVKQFEPHQLADPLARTQLFAQLDAARREPLLVRLAENPPFFFEQPDLDPDDKLADEYLADLARVAIRAEPRDMPVESMLIDAGGYLRRDERQMNAIITKQFAAALAEQCATPALASKLTPAIVRAGMCFLEANEKLLFAFEGATCPEASNGNAAVPQRQGDLGCLLGTDRRLLLVKAGELPLLLWLGDASIECKPDEGRWIAGCRVIGGAWLDGHGPAELHLRGATMRRFESYFAPLLSYGKAPAPA